MPSIAFTVNGKPVSVSADGDTPLPLELNVDVRNAPLGGRVLGVKILSLRFRPA